MTFGQAIKEGREAKGLTQRELAEIVNISRAAIARIEGMSLMPSTLLAQQLLIALDLPADIMMYPLAK